MFKRKIDGRERLFIPVNLVFDGGVGDEVNLGTTYRLIHIPRDKNRVFSVLVEENHAEAYLSGARRYLPFAYLVKRDTQVIDGVNSYVVKKILNRPEDLERAAISLTLGSSTLPEVEILRDSDLVDLICGDHGIGLTEASSLNINPDAGTIIDHTHFGSPYEEKFEID